MRSKVTQSVDGGGHVALSETPRTVFPACACALVPRFEAVSFKSDQSPADDWARSSSDIHGWTGHQRCVGGGGVARHGGVEHNSTTPCSNTQHSRLSVCDFVSGFCIQKIRNQGVKLGPVTSSTGSITLFMVCHRSAGAVQGREFKFEALRCRVEGPQPLGVMTLLETETEEPESGPLELDAETSFEALSWPSSRTDLDLGLLDPELLELRAPAWA